MTVSIAGRPVGDGHPCFVIAEIGQNHNGDLDTALAMMRAAKAYGADAVKFQMRTPELAIPAEQQSQRRSTPWGEMSYLDYRKRLEFGACEYDLISRECRALGLPWFASAWDEPSVNLLLRYEPPAIKVASASVTDLALLRKISATGLPVIMSTGMSTLREIDRAVETLHAAGRLVLLHCKSAYPCPPEDVNLAAIHTLHERYRDVPIGFSDHTVGLWLSLCAVALGACVLERHVTENRASWGTDQASSVEPQGMRKLIEQIRRFEQARGTGRIGVAESERPVMAKLRRVA